MDKASYPVRRQVLLFILYLSKGSTPKENHLLRFGQLPTGNSLSVNPPVNGYMYLFKPGMDTAAEEDGWASRFKCCARDTGDL